MTVAALNPSVQYIEDAVTVGFAVPFRFKSPQHLRAVRLFADGSIDVLAYGTDYSATGGTTDAGGTLTVTLAAVAGTRLAITRATPRVQAMNYATADTFPAESHEGALDNSMLVDQEQDVAIDDLGERSLMVPPGQQAPGLSIVGLLDGDIIRYQGGQFQRLPREPFAGMFYAGDALGRMIPASGTGADGALRADLAANGGVIVGTDGGSTAQDDIDGIRGFYPLGAAGDGVTNDKAVIDPLNLAETRVNLMGKDYAYTGDWSPQAEFVGGRIISSTMGIFDYRSLFVLGNRTVTVGSAGTLKSARAAAIWLKSLFVVGTLTFQCLEHNTPDTNTGSMALSSADARYMGPGKVVFEGAVFGGGQGAYKYTDLPSYAVPVADLAGFLARRATTKTYLRTQFNGGIRLLGNDDGSGSIGITGAIHFRRMYIEAHGRYSIDGGFLGGHQNSQSGQASITFEDCCVDGGVWGAIAAHSRINATGTHVSFINQISGGPLDLIASAKFYALASTTIDMYFPLVTTPFALQPQTAVTCDGGDFECGVAKLRIWGPFLHAFLTRGLATIYAPDVVVTHAAHICTATDGAQVNLGNFTGNNLDPQKSIATPGATQPNLLGNSGSKAAVFAGRGAMVNCDGGSFNNCDNLLSYCLADGGTIQTFNKITATSSRCLGANAAEFAAINGGSLMGKFGIVTPLVGGNDWYFVSKGGRILLFADDGTLAYNLAKNSCRDGAIITDFANNGGGFWVQGQKLLAARQAAIPNIGGAPTAADYNALLGVFRAHNLIAP